jgi:hypothetical protein
MVVAAGGLKLKFATTEVKHSDMSVTNQSVLRPKSNTSQKRLIKMNFECVLSKLDLIWNDVLDKFGIIVTQVVDSSSPKDAFVIRHDVVT